MTLINEIVSPIKSIGIEIGGGWSEKPKSFKKDGSVLINSVKFVGEIHEAFDNLESATKWVKQDYPNFINNTCAIHVHIEVANKELFDQIMTKRFYLLFRKNAKDWATANKITKGSQFWQRYNGDNIYCGKGFSEKEKWKQVSFRNKDRNVIEFRLFPAFRMIKLSESAVVFCYNLVNNYLGLRSFIG